MDTFKGVGLVAALSIATPLWAATVTGHSFPNESGVQTTYGAVMNAGTTRDGDAFHLARVDTKARGIAADGPDGGPNGGGNGGPDGGPGGGGADGAG